MGDHTKIEWTDTTWNPLAGCELVSDGCTNCYAAREASGRLSKHPVYAGLASDGKFTGEVRLLRDRLDQPLHWTKPRRVFVNSMSDLFHADVPDSFIAEVFAVMAATPHHSYQVLTKRHGRLRSLLRSPGFANELGYQCGRKGLPVPSSWPLPNVWLGVSVEDQRTADLRIPALLDTPAAVRFLSCEPLLGPVSLVPPLKAWANGTAVLLTEHLHWVIVGGESGPAARPMHPGWARRLRDECNDAGVPYLFKQWGEWVPDDNLALPTDRCVQLLPDGTEYTPDRHIMWHYAAQLHRVGKKAAGRELDGRTWDEYPDRLAGTPTPC